MKSLANPQDKAELLSRLQSVTSTTHPTFGHMSPAQWHRWAYLHVDHHLRQFGA